MKNKLIPLLAMILVVTLAGCGLKGGESKTSGHNTPSSVTSTETIDPSESAVPGNRADNKADYTETEMQLEETMAILDELEDALNSLDTIRDQDLITP